MTERGSGALTRSASHLAIANSALHWRDGVLDIAFDEWTAPLPTRIRGSVRVAAGTPLSDVYALDAAARHCWRPLAPRAPVEVELSSPHLRWRGDGYVDCNWGAAPLEEDFSAWQWSRAHGLDGEAGAEVHYDVLTRAGESRGVSLRFDRNGAATMPPPPWRPIASTAWGVTRRVRSATTPRLTRTLEDTPFYARSWLKAQARDRLSDIVHESLSLDRLRSPFVRAMLPFRMPRRLL